MTALTKQVAALHAWQNIVVHTDLCAEPDLPLKVKQDLYRVAQEALHNTVKHARANKIELRLHQTGGVVILEVWDNGRGFLIHRQHSQDTWDFIPCMSASEALEANSRSRVYQAREPVSVLRSLLVEKCNWSWIARKHFFNVP